MGETKLNSIRVLVTPEIENPVLEELKKRFDLILQGKVAGSKKLMSEEELSAIVRREDPEILVIEAEPVTEKVLSEAKSLKLVICARGNPVNVDIRNCTKRGIIVTNAPGRNANAVAEFTIAEIICCARMIPQAHCALFNRQHTIDEPYDSRPPQKDVIWVHNSLNKRPYELYKGIELEGRLLGLIGLGYIGAAVSKKANALGMKVIAYDPFLERDAVTQIGADKAELDDVISKADFISLHAPVNESTIGMIGERELSLMKPTAFLINNSRGALVNQDALVKALCEKRIAGAALDVFKNEPLSDDDPLLELDNVVLTPHIGGASSDVIRQHSRMILEDINAFANNDVPPHALNHEEVKAFLKTQNK